MSSCISPTHRSIIFAELPLLKNGYHQTQTFVSSWQAMNPEDPLAHPPSLPFPNEIFASYEKKESHFINSKAIKKINK